MAKFDAELAGSSLVLAREKYITQGVKDCQCDETVSIAYAMY